MGVKLVSSSGGSVELVAPTTASNYTMTVPANSGTVITTASTFAGTGPAFSAYQSAAQTGLSYNTWSKVTLTSVDFDTNSNYSSSKFTPTVAGYYQINVGVTVPYPASTGLVFSAIYKNGSAYKYGNVIQGNATFYPVSTASTVVYCNGTTDYIELYVNGGNNGGSYQTWNGQTNTYFNAAMVRSA